LPTPAVVASLHSTKETTSMRNVRVDTKGELRCWNCGSATFREKRTLRSKVLVGVGSLLTKKKLKCQLCGEYNDVGHAQPYKGPAKRRLGKKYRTFTNMHGVSDGIEVEDTSTADEAPDPVDVPEPTQGPAGWYPDPAGRHEHRYFDGSSWTANVSDAGTQSVDELA
jgi:hypothetical protein